MSHVIMHAYPIMLDLSALFLPALALQLQEGHPAIMLAAHAGHVRIVRLLLANGAKAHMRDKRGKELVDYLPFMREEINNAILTKGLVWPPPCMHKCLDCTGWMYRLASHQAILASTHGPVRAHRLHPIHMRICQQ